jgi:1-acyl-sn-glycerol-3-phosphate acyltransferase
LNTADVTWAVGRRTVAPPVALSMRLRHYGSDRIPLEGGVVLAMNHFSWGDVIAFGWACPRTIYYVAKSEADSIPVLGAVMRSLGTFPIRRGQSDRNAVRVMRQTVRDGRVLGVFAEGTRQRSGVPGEVQAGAAMVAINEGVPVVVGAVHGSQTWSFPNFHPVTIAWSEPMRFEGLPRNGRGYKEASKEIQSKIRELWQWLVDLHELDRRPRAATPPQ